MKNMKHLVDNDVIAFSFTLFESLRHMEESFTAAEWVKFLNMDDPTINWYRETRTMLNDYESAIAYDVHGSDSMGNIKSRWLWMQSEAEDAFEQSNQKGEMK